jgi:hypothetical protein
MDCVWQFDPCPHRFSRQYRYVLPQAQADYSASALDKVMIDGPWLLR